MEHLDGVTGKKFSQLSTLLFSPYGEGQESFLMELSKKFTHSSFGKQWAWFFCRITMRLEIWNVANQESFFPVHHRL